MASNYKHMFSMSFSKFDRYLAYNRFMQFMTIGDPHTCWIWKGSRFKDGYGAFSWKRKRSQGAHVASYILFIGNIPNPLNVSKKKKLQVCHTCDNPPCVNPNHLFLGTQKVNIRDMYAKGRDPVSIGIVNKRVPYKKTGIVNTGEVNGNAKLTWDIVDKIRDMYKKGYSQVRLSKKFRVSQPAVYQIVSMKTWKDTVQ